MNNITFQFGEGEIAPSSTADGEGTFTVISRVKDAVPMGTTPDVTQVSHNPFPEGLNISELPDVVQKSWKYVQVYLSPEKQSKISYYQKNGEWFINLDGTKISLQNETAENNSDAGINVRNGNAYFSQSAAQKHAKSKGQELPTNDLWKKMSQFLGGLKQLKDILQIPLNGWFHPVDGLLDAGLYANVWSDGSGEYLYVYADDGDVYYYFDTSYGLSVRLLDT